MPAETNARKSKPKSRGRPSGSSTKFPGSCVFAKSVGVTATHLYRVLIGERQSKTLVAKYAAWLAAKQEPWPQAAKVKP